MMKEIYNICGLICVIHYTEKVKDILKFSRRFMLFRELA